MRSDDRATYICKQWHEIGIRQRHYLSDVPYHDLAPEHRKELMKRALPFAKAHKHVPFVVMRGDEKKQLW